MYNNRPHALLEQVPLTVSPFISLPAATTLSYNYKTMPSTLPPSALGIPAASEDPSMQPKPRFVISGSGHAAHPEDIISSCRALQAHIDNMQAEADRELRGFEERRKERELAEKRRLAPGWLDSEARILEPERSKNTEQDDTQMPDLMSPPEEKPQDEDEGAELDKAFGGMELKDGST